MTDSDEVPLCGEQIFLYPGNPGCMGTLDYTEDDYRKDFPSLDFAHRRDLLSALEEELETRDLDIFREVEEARFKIPDYQRHYSWKEEDHQRLWYKILQISQLSYTPGENPPENFFGTIYVGELEDRKRYEVIDGQQRLTTVAILLECIRREYEKVLPNLSGDLERLGRHIQEDWVENLLLRQQGVKEVPFLQVSSHDQPFFELLFEADQAKQLEKLSELTGYDGRKKYASTLGDVIETLDISDATVEESDEIIDEEIDNSYVYFAESHQLLVDAFKYYENSLSNFITDDEQFPTDENAAHALINVSLFVLRSFRISEIMFTGDNKELRVNVFQELNDAGQPLTTKDKIKARIVSLFQQSSSSHSVEDELDTWSDIVEEFADKSERVEEFLVTYVQATRNPDGAQHARDNLLDLFRLTDIGGHEFTPQLTSDVEGHEFLEELYRFSQRFVEIEDLNLDGGSHPLDDDLRKRCEEILRRLTKLNTTQWIPFVLFLYDDVSSRPGKGEFFYDVLRTIESLIFRVSLSEVRTTVIESTFMESAQQFRDAKESTKVDDPYDAEGVSKLVLTNVEENRQLTGETLADTIIRSRGWSNTRAKQLFLKIVDEQFGREDGMTRRDIDGNASVDIEHVFPRAIIREGDSDPYAWLSDFFPETGSAVLESESNIFELRGLLEKEDAAIIGEDHEMYDRIQRIHTHIKSNFVEDLGNMIILEGGVNRAIQNRRFALKLRSYHKEHPEDIKNAVNEYFSTDNPGLTEAKVNELTELDVPTGYDDTEPSLDAIEDEFNGWWNIDRMAERKTKIVSLILESLVYDIDEEEFTEEFDELLNNRDELKNSIEDELQKRSNQAI